jgi:Flp pilus assembly protein TadG
MRAKRYSRSSQRGAAAIEMALSMILLLPLIFGMIDFGYYFYVASTASEAARVAARQASITPGACGTAAAGTTKTTTESAVATYMTQAGLGTAVTTSATATCTTVGTLTPAWRLVVTVDFTPPIGFIRPLMKQSATPGKVTYSQTVVVLGS